MEETLLERKYPTTFSEERIAEHQKAVDRNSERTFLFNFLCGTLKTNFKKADWLWALPKIDSYSFMNITKSSYCLFFRESGYEHGQTHFNLKTKHRNQDEKIYYCCPGDDNFYSATYFYFFNLAHSETRML